MSDDAGPKSSFELVMERLRKQDAEEGVTCTADDRRAEERNRRSAEPLRLKDRRAGRPAAVRVNGPLGADSADLDEVGRQFRPKRERLASERDAKVEKIRRDEP